MTVISQNTRWQKRQRIKT